MPSVARFGDINVAGGVALGGAKTVFVNGRPMMIPKQTVTPHPCCGQSGCDIHCNAKTQGGSPTVQVEGSPVLHVDDVDTCGHKRSSPSPDVFVQG